MGRYSKAEFCLCSFSPAFLLPWDTVALRNSITEMKWAIILLASAAAVSAGGWKTKFAKNGVKAHNAKRDSSYKLKLDKKLCSDAQAYVNYLAENDLFQHAKDIDQGENIYMAGPVTWTYSDGSKKQEAQDVKAKDAVQAWWNEVNTGEQCMGHYTQVMWKGSKKFCMAKAESKTKNVYTVARYYPRGNFYMQGHKLEAWHKNVDEAFQFP